jgi:hypothetical protein
MASREAVNQAFIFQGYALELGTYYTFLDMEDAVLSTSKKTLKILKKVLTKKKNDDII